ncbi:MAG TPA: response regulator transcription factor [Anaerolineae bacterium]|nr:response regulator transcription factor [Anaerolineae bacterium]
MAHEIRVLIADDHAIVRKGICALLSTEPGIAVVGEAHNALEAMAQAERLRPDVVLMDLVMPGLDGLEAIQRICTRLPKVRILVLTGFAGDDKVFPAIRAGAMGYLLKDSAPEELVQAIRQVHSGRASLHPVVARRLLQAVGYPLGKAPSIEHLTGREMEVLQLLAAGLSNLEIASQLGITESTVRAHVTKVLSKLGLASRTQAALFALREGVAPLEPELP